MDHARRQASDRGKFLRASDGAICFHSIGDFLADSNDVRDLSAVVGPHRDLADDPVPDVTFWRWRFLLDALDLTALKHAREFLLQHVAWLAREHVENVLAEHRAARDTELSEFAVAVPRHYSILAIDRIKRQRQTIDNRFNESALRFSFRSLFFDFPRQAH